MFLQKVFPFTASPQRQKKTAIDVSSINLSKVFKVRAFGLNFNSGVSSYMDSSRGNRGNFEVAPYDFERIIEAIDTDSYVKQAFFKYKELLWKEGWDIVSENPDAVSYLWQRIDFMEEVMSRPFNDFLAEVVDQLVKFGNVFIVESRADIRPFFKGHLIPPPDKETIAGYYLIPTETVKIYRNKFNTPISYRQSLMNIDVFAPNQKTEPVWSADQIVHMYLDKKPGRAFGTPFMVSVLDDVVALRQIEEDIQNLIHKELFPLYKYTVGTETQPSSPEEIENAAQELANLRVEGGLILPERHDVDVIGANGNALDAVPYLQQFKERVAVGMGLSPHHLGMLASGGNRSVTDRLDTALYDKIKLIQSYVEEAIRLYLFNPLLREGGFDPSTNPVSADMSDRCYMRFKEIDIDTQVKQDTHTVNLFNSSIIDLEETRIKLGLKPDVNVDHLLMNMAAHLAVLQQTTIASAAPRTPNAQGVKPTPAQPKGLLGSGKPDAAKPSTGIVPNKANNKGASNIIRPANQHGRRTSPNIRHMDEAMLNDIVNLLENEDNDE